ncbi:YchJ family protein [Rhodococcus sp. NPDC058514]|uniref:YchJ family protein n=1 Tax=unclassified Rhodococcus (in: high G+C Gram-positive bacteria) TaxID=192944 RepID=UPI00364C1778
MSITIRLADDARCPCLSGDTYGACCGRYHSGAAQAPTAEALMRSRYSAFAEGDTGYLLRTWHPSTRPRTLELDDNQRWLRLDILGRSGGGLLESEGTVEFVAYYRYGRERKSLREHSRFVREGGKWFYLDALD